MNLESKRRKLKRGIEIVQGQNLFCQGTVCDEICYVDVSPSYEQYLFFQQYRNINISGTYLPKSRFFTCVIQIIQGQYVFNQCTVCDKICYVYYVNLSCEKNGCSSSSIEILKFICFRSWLSDLARNQDIFAQNRHNFGILISNM